MQSMAEYKTSIEETDTGYRHSEGNMTKEEAARLAAERERTKGMNVRDAAAAAQDSLNEEIAAKKRFNEIRNMIGAGKHKHMTLEQKKALVAEYKKLKADYSFAKGGIPKQMELFDDGGLMDEGGTTDPVSGNDVPPGSTQEEVRDDIPAQLSEGEFVFPADVVRYVGLENLMRIRQEAKQGLAEMEAMGQMGNSEEAAMPDNLPFDEYDLEVEDDGQGELNFQVGGYVPPSLPNQVNPMTGVYQTGTTGITGYQSYQGQPTGFTPYGGATPFFQPAQFTGPQYTTALQTTNLPTFAETVGAKAGQYDELRTYQNDAGQTLQIPIKNGQPIYPVPAGYKAMTDEPVKDTQPTVTPTLGQTQVSDVDNSGKEGDDDKPPSATDVTGFGVTTKGLTSGLKDVFSTYGSGLGVLKETFLDKPASSVMKASSKVPTSIMGLLSGVTGSEYEPSAKTASLNAASLQGVLDAFRGIKNDAFANPVLGTTAPRRNKDIYGGGIVGTQDFGLLDKTTQNIVETVARATIEKAQSFYFDVDGDPFTSSQTTKSYTSALQNDFNMTPDQIEAVARRGGNYNRNEKLANEWAKRTTEAALTELAPTVKAAQKAIEDFNKDAKESEVSFSTDTYDRSREATFSGDQPGSIAEQAEAEKASADLGIFG